MIVSLDVIILGIIAGLILFRLYTILGQKDNDGNINFMNHSSFKEVIDISLSAKNEDILAHETPQDTVEGFEDIIAKIRVIEPHFSSEKFLNNSKIAFEMILLAFAENDRVTLKNLLSPEIYKQFISEIDKRNLNKISLNLTLVAIPVAKILNMKIEDNILYIDMLYESQQITLLKNAKGEIIEGNPSQIDNVEDYWTFAKELDGKNNWLLVKVNAS